MVDFAGNRSLVPEEPNKFIEWIVLHKIRLKTGLKIFLIVLIAALWGYGIYGIIDWYFITGPAERNAIAHLQDTLVNYSVRKPVKSLEVRSAALLANGKYDAYARIRNSNADWSAVFEYHFVIPGEKTEVKQGFILPGEEKFIFDLGIAVKGKPTKAEISLDKVSWKRVRIAEIPDYENFKNARLAFDFGTVQYNPSLQIAGRTVSRAEFTVANKTGFGYFEVPLQIILWRGGVVAGINQATVQNLMPGEARPVDATWFDAISGITKVEVRADLNILNPTVYIK